MEIRFARAEDLEQIIALEEANFSQEERIAAPVLAIYARHLQDTCLVMEDEGQLAGFLLACPTEQARVEDAIFYLTADKLPQGQHLAIASLSVAPAYQGQGVGTLLLAGLKEVAQSAGYKGIALTCKEYLIGYYKANQFEEIGSSLSQFGGQSWCDMYWQA